MCVTAPRFLAGALQEVFVCMCVCVLCVALGGDGSLFLECLVDDVCLGTLPSPSLSLSRTALYQRTPLFARMMFVQQLTCVGCVIRMCVVVVRRGGRVCGWVHRGCVLRMHRPSRTRFLTCVVHLASSRDQFRLVSFACYQCARVLDHVLRVCLGRKHLPGMVAGLALCFLMSLLWWFAL